VTLDGAVGDEEHLGDLAVGEILARELGGAPFARRQRLEPGEDDPAWTRAGGTELRLRTLRAPSGRGRRGRGHVNLASPRANASTGPFGNAEDA
jgi:hypothetical protein